MINFFVVGIREEMLKVQLYIWYHFIFGLVYLHPKTKIFQDFPSHRIFRRMHGVLNIDENKN